jgi:superfamily II DNA or RNA helicase
LIYYPPVTRIVCEEIVDECANAWRVKIDSEEYWIPFRVGSVLNYLKAILDVESWFVRQCLADACADSRNRAPVPLAELVAELSYPVEEARVDQAASRTHQRAAFEKLKDRLAFALLMKCRTGKTKVGIDLACHHALSGRIRQVLWLCPVSVIPTARWQWGRFGKAPQITEPDTLRIFGLETLSRCKVERFEALHKWALAAPTLCVIDESHMVKTPHANRSRRAEALAQVCAVKGIMSGSPITRDIGDIYAQLKILDWRILYYRNKHQFDRKHIEYSTKYPGVVARTRNESYIAERSEPFVFEYFPPDNAADVYDTERVWMSEEQSEWYERIKGRIIDRIERYEARAQDIYLLFTALQSVLSGEISPRILRHVGLSADASIQIASPKLDALAELRAEIDEKVIVWCSRRHEIETIVAALPDTYRITGDIPSAERHEIIQRFRQSACGTLVAMTQVAKRGIDIFEADTAIFYGQSFDYESREQAAARIQAPGIKKTPCRYVDLIYNDSLDERIQASHGRKENIIKSFVRLMRISKEKAIEEMRKL